MERAKNANLFECDRFQRRRPALPHDDDPINASTLPVFHVVVAYEDLDTGQRAMELYSELLRRLGPAFLFHNHVWKFTVLRNAKMQQLAADEAASADVIIISTHENGECPPELKAWVDLWASRRRLGQCALVVLSDSNPPDSLPPSTEMRVYLKEIARRTRMDFFCASLRGISEDDPCWTPAWRFGSRHLFSTPPTS